MRPLEVPEEGERGLGGEVAPAILPNVDAFVIKKLCVEKPMLCCAVSPDSLFGSLLRTVLYRIHGSGIWPQAGFRFSGKNLICRHYCFPLVTPIKQVNIW